MVKNMTIVARGKITHKTGTFSLTFNIQCLKGNVQTRERKNSFWFVAYPEPKQPKKKRKSQNNNGIQKLLCPQKKREKNFQDLCSPSINPVSIGIRKLGMPWCIYVCCINESAFHQNAHRSFTYAHECLSKSKRMRHTQTRAHAHALEEKNITKNRNNKVQIAEIRITV